MIQEIWSKTQNTSFDKLMDFLGRLAAAHAKSDLVLDAYGALPETGDEEEFNKTYLVLVFESLATRAEYYAQGVSDEVKALNEEGAKNQYSVGKLSHWYLNICRQS